MAGKKQNKDIIRIGDYIISADSLQWILSKEKISRGSKNPNLLQSKGEKIITVLGYYSTLRGLVSAISDDTLKDSLSEVEELRDLVETSMIKLIQAVKNHEHK